jgi:hypothetical protein
VVSEIGEQWSPNTPPPKIADKIKPGGRFKVLISGTPRGIKMAKVPHDVPVEKEMSAPTIKRTGAIMMGERFSPTIPATY